MRATASHLGEAATPRTRAASNCRLAGRCWVGVKKHLDQAIEKYGSGLVPQVALGSAGAILGVLFPPAALAAAIPVAAQAGLAARASKIQQDRVEQARAEVAEQVERLNEKKLDREFIESDQFFDWLREAFDRIQRADDAEKRAALRNVFVNGLIHGQSSGPLKAIILRRVGDLSAHHIRAMQAWSRIARPVEATDVPVFTSMTNANAHRPFARIEEFRTALPDLSDLEFRVLINDLETLDVFGDWQARGTYDALQPLTRVILTDFGSALMTYISDPSND